MKKKISALICATALFVTMLSGCTNAVSEVTTGSIEREDSVETETSISETTETENTEATENTGTSVEIVTEDITGVTIHIGGLKGPTSIGLLALMDDAANGLENAPAFEFTMSTAADEITTAFVKGELDIALIPANVASVLYNKTEGQVTVIDINTLGVLYVVSGDDTITSPSDLSGKTVYLTGKGTTPDYVLQRILSDNNVTDVTLEYKSEATEVAAVLSEDSTAVGLLPQPFVTVACSQNENLKVVLDMTEEWDKLEGDSGSRLVTGVTIVRDAFLEEHPEAVARFVELHAESAAEANNNTERVAALSVEAGIIAKEPIAVKAIANCNITCITGNEMKQALSGYLSVLYNLDPSSVGGALPGDDFYGE